MGSSWKLILFLSVTGCLSESVDYGPVFVQEPDDVVFPADSDEKKVALDCEARGDPAPNYRWLRNGTEIDLESDYRYSLIEGNFIISSPSEAKDSGSYQCLASNTFGSILSREAILQFAYLRNFSGRTRSAVSVREGQGVVLICSPPPHSPEISYSWVFNEFPSFVAEDSRRFISQDTGNLYISKVQAADVGSYICLVKNTVTNARVLSPPTPLTLRNDGVMGEYEPKIEVHFPFMVTAAKGTTVKMECFALGNPVPTISWVKVNGYIPSKARLRKSQGVLEIPNVQLDDAGMYECRAENSRGRNSFRGQLQVFTYPHWVERLNDTHLDSGSPLRWECKAIGKPRPTVRWLKNGLPLWPRSGIEMVNGILMIHNVNQSDAGMYQCLAENKYGTIYANAELKILASAPTFALNQLKQTIVITKGQEVIIECKPQASPKPTISWKKGDKAVRESKRTAVLPDGSLRILNASKYDEGKYICQGENVFGSAEFIASVFVKEPTRIELAPKRTELTVGESIVLSCKAIHDPSLDVTFYWTLKGQPIDFEKDGGHFESIRAQASSADLMIRNILLMHAGRYGCRVQTTADSVSDEAELLVRGPPGSPGIVIVEEITENTATLSWSPGADNHSPITAYNLQARSPFSLGWQTVKTVPDVITGDMESAMAVDLNPWVEYEFRVVATNPIGTGDPSAPSRMIRTNEAVPKTAPANVSGRSGRRHELVIAWEPVSEEFQNGEGFGYIVAFRPNGTRGWKEKMVTSSDASKFIYRDESVPPLTPFEVKVGVYNNKGDGPFSHIVVICSAEGEPSTAPTDVKATSVSVSEILVSWKHIKESLGRPQGFEVGYWRDMDQEEAAEMVKTGGNESSVLLTRLEGNTLYHLTVRAFNGAGYGPPSAEIQAATKKSPPSQAPQNIMWEQQGSQVSLGWEPVRPLANESEVMGYKVSFRHEGQSNSEVIETQKNQAVVLLPDVGVYIIEVRAFSEGGDGTASSQIRVPSYSGGKITSAQSTLHTFSPSSSSVTLLLALIVPSTSW
ncbi:contactin-5 [Ornithorhynchus anatinus]|uniref:Contactin-5 n=1 Tax=Ornithorhynchus anatinus TaxID=9258 RepID=F7AAE5_ORNAN|nr:contactin-5 [Ornithorhynchus anatinus]XP_028904025.1 contactin-5 [Ornithorhynchus anatinus]XP_028904026.1 contactin-5 [Ornithorhynchus anatinus]XP_028904027.1 contactin-5 [Ornithorhynchus anatinus]XP_028904028.1 contactin-5 [Ornithorhynchus anatinus]XP_028904029.1 contactin-5 [Ornithorhynchus anatinus]XP_028904030.1 contactin-5 [Ornithorhynchus anatinus]XP_028904031.1 contactin-5 [Ornithorhynchus anatinus]XP_028904032.1 contactin-5 [Ornithorhynchus anatinus]XP_028904034.1 contactin-5 [O